MRSYSILCVWVNTAAERTIGRNQGFQRKNIMHVIMLFYIFDDQAK